jgi:hypothetical protein
MATEIVSSTIASTSKNEATLKNELPPPPPTQLYNFLMDSFQVLEPRSGSLGGFDKGNDSDYVGFSIQVNNGTSQQQTKFIGNNCHSGTFNVGLAFNSIALADTDAVAVIATIVNSSSGEAATTKYLSSALSKLASAAGKALGTYATNEILTQAVKDEIGAAIGATLGTAIVPLLGSALGALSGFLVGEAWGILFPNCDGPSIIPERTPPTDAATTPTTMRHTLWSPCRTCPRSMPASSVRSSKRRQSMSR